MATYSTNTNPDEAPAPVSPPLRNNSILATDMQSTILDETWSKQAFLVSVREITDNTYSGLESIDIRNRTFSTAYLKFEDTTLGGSYAINPKPQFTRYSDIRVKGRLAGRNDTSVGAFDGKLGMGRYYSEAIHDNGQTIHMRFGVPQYNSLTKFFTGFYDTGAGRLARTGRTSNFFGAIGSIVGTVAQIFIWQVAAVHALGYVARFFFGSPTSRYYYLKPTMLQYWGAVNTMVNNIAVGKGLVPVTFQKEKDQPINEAFRVDEKMQESISAMLPGIISESGGFDIYAIAGRAQRMKIARDNQISEEQNKESGSDFYGLAKKHGQEILTPKPGLNWINRVERWLKTEATIPKTDSEGKDSGGPEADIKPITSEPTVDAKGEPIRNDPNKKAKWLDLWWTDLVGEWDDGSAFATLRVDYTGPVTESFSNSVRDSDIAGKVNSASSTARSASFSFAGGNIGGGPIGAVAQAVVGAAVDFTSGVLDSMQFSGLLGIAGGSFVDIPKHWDSSSASLPKSTYTIQLTSPYGNVISQMQNIYIPLCMLLAAALPLSTGKQSYTSPFILELYDKGRHQTRLGMIDSLSITRGTSNLGFNKSGQAMAIDVSFSVVDMSSVMHMQMSKGFSLLSSEGIFDEETVFSDYMNTLSSLGVHEQFHKLTKLRLNAARKLRNLQQLTSPAAWALWVKENTPVGDLEVIFTGTQR